MSRILHDGFCFPFLPGSGPVVYVPVHGGYSLTIAETITAGQYIVHIGKNGNASDPIAYPGVPGEGTTATFVDLGGGASSATVWLPPLDIGAGYQFFLEGVGVADKLLTDFTVTVIPRVFKSGEFSLKQTFPPHYKTGPRTAEQVRFPQV